MLDQDVAQEVSCDHHRAVQQVDQGRVPELLKCHRDDLYASGLSDATILRAAFYAATAAATHALLGYRAGPGLVIPYPELNGDGPYARVKLDRTPADGKRYRSPKGRGNRLYVPALLDPCVLADVTAPLWITEGEKKALKAAQEGLACVAVPGVWSWRTRDHDGLSVPIPDLDHVAWQGRDVFIVYDSDLATKPDVRRAEVALARELQRRGAEVRAIRLPAGPHGEKVGLDDYLLTHSVEAVHQLKAVDLLHVEPRRPARSAQAPAPPCPGRAASWHAAQPAPDFLVVEEAEQPFLEARLLARGSITEFFSPRGLGKTHVAHALAVKHARAGRRVLLLDRDNSRREVRRRLRGWGAAGTPSLRVLTRDHAPAMTDRAAWQQFPFAEYDLVIVDSIDAATEGVGEQDSAKPARALAPLLDIARRETGPAILVLGNVVKSGAHGRGSGVVEDRADIVFEVRDATGLEPSGTKAWWLELPPAGRDAWADRAVRRRRRDRYRLAFIPSKFRIGEEPDPFILEIDLSTEPWQLQDVTGEVEAGAQAAFVAAAADQKARQTAAARALEDRIREQAEAGAAWVMGQAETFLVKECKLRQKVARQLLRDETGARWRVSEDVTRRGRPLRLFPAVAPQAPGSTAVTTRDVDAKYRAFEASSSVAAPGSGRRETRCEDAAPHAVIRDLHASRCAVNDPSATGVDDKAGQAEKLTVTGVPIPWEEM
jgi:hypothetical protein